MGVKLTWHFDVLRALAEINPKVYLIDDEQYSVIECSSKVYVNLVSLATVFNPQVLIDLQNQYKQEGKLVVHLWEDVWLAKAPQVLNRISSFLGLNQTLHGRKAEVIALDLNQTITFFNQYHLQGYIKAKYTYGLLIDKQLVAAASFSVQRPMQSKGVNYYSAELVRFASKDKLTIVGGLSKLIKYYTKQVNVNDIMSYADRDWSLGKGYDQLGFELSAITDPAYLFVDEKTHIRYFPHRLPKKVLSAFDEQKELNLEEYLAQNGFAKAFNTGNLKYHLYV